jgi:surface protein
MSLRTPSNSNLAIPGTQPNRRSLSGQTQPVVQAYARPADWVAIGTSTATQYVQLLVPVWDVNSNYIAFTTTGATTIDWGDGTAPENVASNTQANHNYAYANVSNLSSRGYRQAVITITPQAGQNITAFDIQKRHSSQGIISYATPILDMTLKVPNLVTTGNLVIGATSLLVQLAFLEQVTILSHGLTSFNNMFRNCINLQSVPFFDTASVTNMTAMFHTCRALLTVPLYNTRSVTNMTSMFQNCVALQTVPLFDTRSVTTMSDMFNACVSLVSVPLFNTATTTTFSNMFNGCRSLQTVPLFDTRAAQSLAGTFNGTALTTIPPIITTSALTSVGSMFAANTALQSVPLFNTANVTDMSSMFSGCSSLQSVPLFNTANVTDMSSMFLNCLSLKSFPSFNTSKVTTMANMVQNCSSLQTITFTTTTSLISMNNFSSGAVSLKQMVGLNGPFNISSATNVTNAFSALNSLSRCQVTGTNVTISFASGSLGGTELNEIFYGLSVTGAGKTITITGNVGTSTCTRSIATAKGWTVSG